MTRDRYLVPILLLTMTVATAGCANRSQPLDPGLINHVVLFNLQEKADIPELERDCAEFIRQIPTVAVYACGGHYDTGREIVDGSYDVGLFVSFRTPEDYQAYLADPMHVELVEKWKSRWSEITIYDIENR